MSYYVLLFPGLYLCHLTEVSLSEMATEVQRPCLYAKTPTMHSAVCLEAPYDIEYLKLLLPVTKQTSHVVTQE